MFELDADPEGLERGVMCPPGLESVILALGRYQSTGGSKEAREEATPPVQAGCEGGLYQLGMVAVVGLNVEKMEVPRPLPSTPILFLLVP